MRLSVFLLCALPALAWADVDQRFAKLRDQAEPMTAVSAFVEKYVGNCGPKIFCSADCERNSEIFRRGTSGKKYYMIITEDAASGLQMTEGNPRDGTFILNLTPFFAGGDSAITHGAPSRTDAGGNPVLPYIRIKGTLPDGWNMAMMGRQVQSRALRMQVVFTPLGVWKLPKKKGGAAIYGVKARFDAVLVQVGRTGEQIGLWLANN